MKDAQVDSSGTVFCVSCSGLFNSWGGAHRSQAQQNRGELCAVRKVIFVFPRLRDAAVVIVCVAAASLVRISHSIVYIYACVCGRTKEGEETKDRRE